MDAINLEWHDAIAEMGIYFSESEASTGWTESLSTAKIAVLQRPHGIWNIIGIRRAIEFRKFLDMECEKGNLICEKKVLPPPKLPSTKEILLAKNNLGRQRRIEPFFIGSEVGSNIVNKGILYFFELPGKTYYFVTAQNFKIWIESKKRTPSEFIKGWFDSIIQPVNVSSAVEKLDTEVPSSQAPRPKNKRRDLLTPLIEAAQRETSGPFDTPAVWAALCAMAEHKVKPLLGRSEEGIKWIDGNDKIKFFSLKMLRDRLGRQKRSKK